MTRTGQREATLRSRGGTKPSYPSLISLEVVQVTAWPFVGGGGALRRLLRLLFRLAIVQLIFHSARGFLTRYTHVPWLAAIVIIIVVVALVRLALAHRHRRRP